MVETILNNNLSLPLASLPSYGLAIVSAPIVGFLGMKVLLLAKASAANRKRREWVFTQERDADGMPVLATAKLRAIRGSLRRSR
jgi:hypothetical protein